MFSGLLSLYVLAALPAQAALLKPTWSASSTAVPEAAVGYDATNLGDGKIASAWFEGVDGSGLGEWVMADFGGDKTISTFTIWGGYGYSKTYWGHYNRPKIVSVEFSDGSKQEFTLQDAFAGEVVTLPSPKTTSSMRFRVKTVYSSDAVNDTPISEIQIRDTGRDDVIPVKSVTASTTFPADADGSYDARNAADGIIDTMWCEGNKTGDGTKDWVEFNFGSTQSVSRLSLRNGNAASFALYMKSNRATQVSLSFADGGQETLAVKDLISEQTLTFASHTTDRVRVTFDVVKKGSEFNDACVSEATFRP